MAPQKLLVDLFHEGEETEVCAVTANPYVHRLGRRRTGFVQKGEDRILAHVAVAIVRVDVELFYSGGSLFPEEVSPAVEIKLELVLRPVGRALSTYPAENIVVKLPGEVEAGLCSGPCVAGTRILYEPVQNW